MEWNKALTKIRKEKGYSQQQIADHFFTTQQQYSNITYDAETILLENIYKIFRELDNK